MVAALKYPVLAVDQRHEVSDSSHDARMVVIGTTPTLFSTWK